MAYLALGRFWAEARVSASTQKQQNSPVSAGKPVNSTRHDQTTRRNTTRRQDDKTKRQKIQGPISASVRLEIA
ncbi:hypothetical protein A9F13_05g03135 [Clavispora lusitaniae]|uniref:Uncharacterized protein n=1 Tax=Clavispora lusitaniae TaxID=36911 RepID=A0AA91Q2J2_CLALS|nr:hypothetical protein A9F13_05g03135 [Clavispora lusitaniae]